MSDNQLVPDYFDTEIYGNSAVRVYQKTHGRTCVNRVIIDTGIANDFTSINGFKAEYANECKRDYGKNVIGELLIRGTDEIWEKIRERNYIDNKEYEKIICDAIKGYEIRAIYWLITEGRWHIIAETFNEKFYIRFLKFDDLFRKWIMSRKGSCITLRDDYYSYSYDVKITGNDLYGCEVSWILTEKDAVDVWTNGLIDLERDYLSSMNEPTENISKLTFGEDNGVLTEDIAKLTFEEDNEAMLTEDISKLAL